MTEDDIEDQRTMDRGNRLQMPIRRDQEDEVRSGGFQKRPTEGRRRATKGKIGVLEMLNTQRDRTVDVRFQ